NTLLIHLQFRIPIFHIDEAIVGGGIDIFVFARFGMAINEDYDAPGVLGVLPPLPGASMAGGNALKGCVRSIHRGIWPPQAHAVISLAISMRHCLRWFFHAAAFESPWIDISTGSRSDSSGEGWGGE